MTVARRAVVLAVIVGCLPFSGATNAASSQRTHVSGELTIWVVEKDSNESHIAVVETLAGDLEIPENVVPENARTGDRVLVEKTGDTVSRVKVVSARLRAQRAVPDGERRTLVIVASTLSPVASPSSSVSDVAAVMAQVDERYRAFSNNRVSFTTDVVQATVATAACETFSDNVRNASAASGVDTSMYKHIVVYAPLSDCDFAGVASLGGGSVMVVSSGFTLQVLTHEIGHNLGLKHAATMTCGTESAPQVMVVDWANGCSRNEYGDNFSPMGLSQNPSPNAPQLLELGWLDPSQVAVPSTGTVELSPLAGFSGTRTMVLPDPSAQGAYWVEYRTAVGADTVVHNPGQVQVRFLSRLEHMMPSIQTALLNASGTWPASRAFFRSPGMTSPGQSFSDPTGRLTITVVSLGATAVLSVIQDPAVVNVAPTALTTTFTGNDLSVSITEPSTGLRITDHTATLVDSTGVQRSFSTTGTSVYFQAVPPGPATVTVTTTTRDGRTGSTSVNLVSPALPKILVSSLTSTAGGARINVKLSEEAQGGVEYVVTASRKGHATRSVWGRRGPFTVAGLPADGRWTLTVNATVNGLPATPVTRVFRPKRGGVELGKVTRNRDGTSSAVLVVPRARRSDGIARTFLEWSGGARVPRYRIPSNGKLRLRFAANITRVTVSVGSTEIGAVVLRP